MRPNRQRTKTTVYVSAEDRERIEVLRQNRRVNTNAAAIREALREAAAVQNEFESCHRLMLRILHWAEALPWKSDKDRDDLRRIAREVYMLREGYPVATTEPPPDNVARRVARVWRSLGVPNPPPVQGVLGEKRKAAE